MKMSVVIPVHNGEAHLGDAVKCLQDQDFADWEAVVVDDGSTDATPQIADGLAQKDTRVRVVHQPNGGVSVARNRGLDEARGDWIVWLDADDAYVPGCMEIMHVPYEDAVKYAPLGCGELLLECAGSGSPNSTMRMLKALEVTLHNGLDGADGAPIGIPTGELEEFETYDQLEEAFFRQMRAAL